MLALLKKVSSIPRHPSSPLLSSFFGRGIDETFFSKPPGSVTGHKRRWPVPPGLELMPRQSRVAGGEDVGVEGAGARLLEHVAHLFHPGVVVRGLLMFGGGAVVAIDLVEDEFRQVVLLLQEIEAGYAGFFGAVFGVAGGGLLEGVDELRFDARMDDEDVHASIIGPLCCV